MDSKGLERVKAITDGEYHITPKIGDGENVRFIDIHRHGIELVKLLNALHNARLLESKSASKGNLPILRLVDITRGDGRTNDDVATFEDLNY